MNMYKFFIEVLQYLSEVLSFKCYLEDKTETFELFLGNNRTHKMKVFKIKNFCVYSYIICILYRRSRIYLWMI